MNDTASFLLKVLVISAALSGLIKYGGQLLPLQAPYTDGLNGLVTAIVVLPSIVIGIGLFVTLKRST